MWLFLNPISDIFGGMNMAQCMLDAKFVTVSWSGGCEYALGRSEHLGFYHMLSSIFCCILWFS